MYIAELQSKLTPYQERSEDILTSNVFSFFKYAKRDIFLFKFLRLLGLEITKEETKEAEFTFWPSFEDGTEPDLVISVGKYYILVEAKLFSGFGKGQDISSYQLSRELNMGKLEAHNVEKEFCLVAITAHYSINQFIAENLEFAQEKLIWTNWHQVAMLLYEILNTEEELDIATASFASDLYNLLDKKDLRKFAGVSVLHQLRKLKDNPENLFFDPKTAQYRGDFIGFKQTLQGYGWIKPVDHVFRDEQKRSFHAFQVKGEINKAPDHIFLEVKNEQERNG